MAKVHDKFVIELAEVIKGYGNDPDVDDPFRLSEFYRFYELPEIAVSANHFKTMIPLEVVEKNAQPGWIPCSTALPSKYDNYLITTEDGMVVFGVYDPRERQWCRYDKIKSWWLYGIKVLAWMPLPKPWKGEQNERFD